MKRLLFIAMVAFVGLGLQSCDKEEDTIKVAQDAPENDIKETTAIFYEAGDVYRREVAASNSPGQDSTERNNWFETVWEVFLTESEQTIFIAAISSWETDTRLLRELNMHPNEDLTQFTNAVSQAYSAWKDAWPYTNDAAQLKEDFYNSVKNKLRAVIDKKAEEYKGQFKTED